MSLVLPWQHPYKHQTRLDLCPKYCSSIIMWKCDSEDAWPCAINTYSSAALNWAKLTLKSPRSSLRCAMPALGLWNTCPRGNYGYNVLLHWYVLVHSILFLWSGQLCTNLTNWPMILHSSSKFSLRLLAWYVSSPLSSQMLSYLLSMFNIQCFYFRFRACAIFLIFNFSIS